MAHGEHQIIVPAGARLIGGAAGGADVTPKVLELLSEGVRLAELGSEAELAAVQAGVDAGDQVDWRHSIGARPASPHRCRR